MFKSPAANTSEMCANIPGVFFVTTVNRMEFSGAAASDVAGKLTEFLIVPVSRKSRIVSAAMDAAASSAS